MEGDLPPEPPCTPDPSFAADPPPSCSSPCWRLAPQVPRAHPRLLRARSRRPVASHRRQRTRRRRSSHRPSRPHALAARWSPRRSRSPSRGRRPIRRASRRTGSSGRSTADRGRRSPLPSATTRSLAVALRPPHEYAFRVRAPTGRATRARTWPPRPSASGASASSTRTSPRPDHGPSRPPPATSGTERCDPGPRMPPRPSSFTGSQVAWFGTRKATPGHGRRCPSTGTWSASSTCTGRRRSTGGSSSATRGRRADRTPSRSASSGPPGHPYVDIDGFVIVDPPAVDPVLVGAGDVVVLLADRGLEDRRAARRDRRSRVRRRRPRLPGRDRRPVPRLLRARPGAAGSSARRPCPATTSTRPTGATPYFDYFGSRAGDGRQGLVRVRPRAPGGCTTSTRTARWSAAAPARSRSGWLEDDLAANPRACVAAVWHHPRFSSGRHGDNPAVAELWKTLEAAGAELVLNGHDHDYERFAPQSSDGHRRTPTGIREFVVGHRRRRASAVRADQAQQRARAVRRRTAS